MSGRYSRVRRDPIQIVLHGSEERLTIGPGWLQKKSPDVYRKAVKQALMIGAKMLEIERYKELGEEAMGPEIAEAYTQLERIKDGKVDPCVDSKMLRRESSLSSDKNQEQRGTLVKYAKNARFKQAREFTIEAGNLKVYSRKKLNNSENIKHYSLANISIPENLELQKKGPFHKDFREGYEYRILISTKDHKPMMLYSKDSTKDPSDIDHWFVAIKMARHQSASLIASLTTCIKRMLSLVTYKGWQALRLRNEDLMRTKELMHQFTIKLLRTNLAPGWNKWWALWQSRLLEKATEEARMKWGLQALADRTMALMKKPVQNEDEIRDLVVSRVQQKFQQYRNMRMAQDNYALGKSVISRVTQARRGVHVYVQYEGTKQDHVFQLVCTEPVYEEYENLGPQKKMLSDNTVCYTAGDLPFRRAQVYASDKLNMLNMTEFSKQGNHLEKATFSHFVRVDNISGVLLYSPRVEGPGNIPYFANHDVGRGPTFTILGPKVAWNQSIEEEPGALPNAEPVTKVCGKGTFEKMTEENGPAKNLKWLKVTLKCLDANLQFEEPKKESNEEGPEPDQEERVTYAAIYILQKRFTTSPRTHLVHTISKMGDVPFVVAVPCGVEPASLRHFNKEIISIDIIRRHSVVKDDETVIAAGRSLLMELGGEQSSLDIGLKSGSLKNTTAVPLHVLNKTAAKKQRVGSSDGSITVEVSIEFTDLRQTDQYIYQSGSIVSPEIFSVGPSSALYPSLKGTWFDRKTGLAKFEPDNAPSMVQCNIGRLKLPAVDPASERSEEYFIEIVLMGVRAMSAPLVRPKMNWKKIFPAIDLQEIDFNNSKLFLLVPPSYWDMEAPPPLDVNVYKCDAVHGKEAQFSTFETDAKRDHIPQKVNWQKIYAVKLDVQGLRVNDQHRGLRIPLDAATTKVAQSTLVVNTAAKWGDPQAAQAILFCDFTVRNRDHMKSEFLESNTEQNPTPPSYSVCVGDKVILKVERPQMYPTDQREYRRRFLPGKYSDKEKAASKDSYKVPLRQPSLMHEYKNSGIADLDGAAVFKQTMIPDFCRDVVPYKYVLPLTESAFQKKQLPGVYWRVVDDLCATSKANLLVEGLTHLHTIIVGTVLAAHNDRTVDMDITSFVSTWRDNPHHKYVLPGNPVKFRDEAGYHRYILEGIPMYMVRSIQTGFNVYDSRSFSAASSIAYKSSFDIDPRSGERPDDRGGYDFIAGPLPNDSNPSVCQYEWKIHCQAPDELTMCHFVQTLRHVVRQDHFNQVEQMYDFMLSEPQGTGTIAKRRNELFSVTGGSLEVVLVECRRLRAEKPQGFLATHATKLGKNLTKGIIDRPVNAFATFSIRRKRIGPGGAGAGAGAGGDDEEAKEKEDKGTVVLVKNMAEQRSPVVSESDNPKWCELPGLMEKGGYVFRSGNLDSSKQDQYVYTAEISIYDQGLTGKSFISSCEFELNGPPDSDKNLMDPRRPFRNIWVPMELGEVHIMTRYAPNDKSQLAFSAPTVVKYFEYSCDTLPMPSREPISNLLADFGPYNPNLLQCCEQKLPLALEDVPEEEPKKEEGPEVVEIKRPEPVVPLKKEAYLKKLRLQLHDSGYYNKCTEKRQQSRLKELQTHMPQDKQKMGLGLMFKYWHGLHNEEMVEKMTQVFRDGVPAELRSSVWLQITRASSVKGPDKAKREAEFTTLVKVGENFRECITSDQLLEDYCAFHSECQGALQRDDLLSLFERRLKKARQVCTALVTYSHRQGDSTMAKKKQICPTVISYGSSELPVIYEEALLYIAYYMLLPHVDSDENSSIPGVDVFWIMFSLIGAEAKTFSSYFCPPQPVDRYDLDGEKIGVGAHISGDSMVGRKGVMDDLCLLDSVLTIVDKELWLHFQGLGFQLFSFFHKAFLRWFAGFLPTATLYRFWDYLFFTASRTRDDSDPPARHNLIDLALTCMSESVGRAQLLHCKSASEILECFDSIFKNQWDAGELMHHLHHTEVKLWSHAVNTLQIMKLFKDRTEEFYRFMGRCGIIPGSIWNVEDQNSVLMRLLHQSDLEIREKGVTQGHVMKLNSEVLQYELLPTLKEMFPSPMKLEDQVFGGMHRPLPPSVIPYGYLIEGGVLDQAKKYVKDKYKAIVSRISRSVDETPMPYPQSIGPPIGGSPPEMKMLTRQVFAQKVMERLPRWAPDTERIFAQFRAIDVKNPENERISMQEFLASIIICAKGTVSMKAMELFNLFGYYDPNVTGNNLHVIPKSSHAKHVIDTMQGARKDQKNTATRIPTIIDPEQFALQILVYSDARFPKETIAIGAISFMDSFTCLSESASTLVTQIPLWSEAQPQRGGYYGQEELTGDTRSYRGDLDCRIKWLPVNMEHRTTGTIEITVETLRLEMSDAADSKKNPYIEFLYYNTTQKVLQPACPSAPKTLKIYGAAGMVATVSPAEKLNDGSGKQSGYDMVRRAWVWGPSGKVKSPKHITLSPAFFDADINENCIDIRAVRLIVQMISMRCMIPITLRQAILHADQTFTRSGAVAGIEEAYLVAERPEDILAGLKRLGPIWRTSTTSHCVKRQLLQEWELQVNEHCGDLDFCPGFDGSKYPKKRDELIAGGGFFQKEQKVSSADATYVELTLADMNITSPFKNVGSTLVIRYTSAGDGKQRLVLALVDDNGTITGVHNYDPKTKALIAFDPYKNDIKFPYYKLTKEEYLNCFLKNTLLSESMREITSTMDKSFQNTKKVRLQVHLANPKGFDGITDDFMSTLDFGQTVLLEIWDKNHGGTDAFMGEVWLPSLTEFGMANRIGAGGVSMALPVVEANEDSYIDKNEKDLLPSKQRKRKSLADGKPRGGTLNISALWEYPIHRTASDASMEREKLEQTGHLKLTIESAENLAKTDAGRKMMGVFAGKADPYVIAWIRNDITREWYPAYTSSAYGKKSKRVQTLVKSATIDPQWNEEFAIELTSAQFEVSHGSGRQSATGVVGKLMSKSAAQTGASGQDEVIYFVDDPERKIATIYNTSCHGIQLGEPKGSQVQTPDKKLKKAKEDEIQELEQHDIEVNMSDTILDFKEKVNEAMNRLRTNSKKQRFSSFGTLGLQHQVFVFVPPQSLTDMVQKVLKDQGGMNMGAKIGLGSKDVYERAYVQALQDPENYEPLDPIRTFHHYEPIYGFGDHKLPGFALDHTPVLRILEVYRGYREKNSNYRNYLNSKIEKNLLAKAEEEGSLAWINRRNEYDGTDRYWPAIVEPAPAKSGKAHYTIKQWCYVPDKMQKEQDPRASFSEDDTFFPGAKGSQNPVAILALNLEERFKTEWNRLNMLIGEAKGQEKKDAAVNDFLVFAKKVQADSDQAQGINSKPLSATDVTNYVEALQLEAKRKQNERQDQQDIARQIK